MNNNMKTNQLSKKEREVLYWIAMGMKTKEIAYDTHRTVSTVDKHLANIKRKLGAKSTPQAVCNAMRLGVLTP